MKKVCWKIYLYLILALLCVPTAFTDSHHVPTPRVIQIIAKKFEFTPRDIVVKQGEHVVLEFTALDRLHGFSLPELGLRGDIVPGKVLQIKVPTQHPGRYIFICDIFCGEGHEEMAGTLTITE